MYKPDKRRSKKTLHGLRRNGCRIEHRYWNNGTEYMVVKRRSDGALWEGPVAVELPAWEVEMEPVVRIEGVLA